MFSFLKVRKLEKEVRRLLEEYYKPQLTGNNRFLLDEQILRLMYPEYSEEVVRKVWIRLVESRAVTPDPMDGAWCIR